MKISSIAFLSCLGAVSAFGLPFSAPAASSSVKTFGGRQRRVAGVNNGHHHVHSSASPSSSSSALAAATSASSSSALSTRGGGTLDNIDVPLMLYFLFWYVGNYYYNIVSDDVE